MSKTMLSRCRYFSFVVAITFSFFANAETVARGFDAVDVMMAMDAPGWKFESKLDIKFKTVKAKIVLRSRMRNNKFSTKVISEPLLISFDDELKSSVPVTIMILNNQFILHVFDRVVRRVVDKAILDSFIYCDNYGAGLTLDGRQVLMADYGDNEESGRLEDMKKYVAVELEFE